MIKDILKNCIEMQIKTPDWLVSYREQSIKEYEIRQKEKWLADQMIDYFKNTKVNWHITNSKNLAISFLNNFVFVIEQRKGIYGSKYYGNKTFDYVFIIFEDKKEIFSLRNFCDEGTYNTHSFRIPIMDLYDVVVNGEKRKLPVAHVCGLQGFNSALGDSCPAC